MPAKSAKSAPQTVKSPKPNNVLGSAAQPSLETRVTEHREELSKRPKDAELLISQAEFELRRGNGELAIELYEKAMLVDPRLDLKVLYYQWKGFFHQSRQEHQLALEAFTKWAQLEPLSVDALDLQSTLMVRLGRWTDLYLLQPLYRKLAETTIPGARTSAALHLFTLQELGYATDSDLTERTYSALEINPQSPTLRYLLALQLASQRQYDTADRELACALDLDSDHSWSETRFELNWNRQSALILKARLARLRGRSNEALELLQQVEGKISHQGLDELSALLIGSGRYQELLELLPVASQGDQPANQPAWIQTAQMLASLGLGKLDQARRVALGPEQTRQEKRISQHPQDRPESLLSPEEMLKSLKGQKNSSPVLQKKAWAHWQLGNLTESRQYLARALELSPQSAKLWNMLSQVDQELGFYETSQLALVQAESIRHSQQPIAPPGFFWPVHGPALAYRFSASKRIGKGRLRVTGPHSLAFEELGQYALNLLEPHCETFSLEDPNYCDLHLHVSKLGKQSSEADAASLGLEESGLAIVTALAVALAGPNLRPPTWLLFGRLEQDGTVSGPVEIAQPFRNFLSVVEQWDCLLLPPAGASELLEVPGSMWLGRNLILCNRIEEILEIVLQQRQPYPAQDSEELQS
jgi:tetratricopeptide (TPR) repeat protein